MGNLDPTTVVLVLLGVLLLWIVASFVYDLTRPTITRKARVTGKHKTMGKSTYSCTFEFEDGQREEFTISVDTYVALAPGDAGDLDTRGKIFWGFRRESGGGPSGPPLIAEEPLARIKDALFRGRKIDAIRLYRECTGSGLAEAKAAVDTLDAELRAAEPDRFV